MPVAGIELVRYFYDLQIKSKCNGLKIKRLVYPFPLGLTCYSLLRLAEPIDAHANIRQAV